MQKSIKSNSHPAIENHSLVSVRPLTYDFDYNDLARMSFKNG